MKMELIQLSMPLLLSGLLLTLKISIFAVVIGFFIGLGLAIARISGSFMLAAFSQGYSSVFRGTPLMVQLFLFYYGLGQLSFIRDSALAWWVIGDGVRCAILVLALNSAAYTSEILRGGFMSVPKGALEAARACGMSKWLQFRRIEFPIAMRQALPAYGNEVILTLKGSSLASTIAVLEITGHAKRLMSQTFAVIEVFAMAGAIYLFINVVMIVLLRLTERSLMRHMAA
ncbi:ABC transporter permease [Pseudaminobacter salicylatoxidans]|nr:ABC transporter permease subunit [Pseudaminobacter salicylatoxidans]